MNSVQKPTVSSSNYPDSPSPLVVIPKNPHSLLPDSLFVKLSARYLIKLFPLPNTRSVKGPPTAVLKINERKESHLVPKISVLPFPFHWSGPNLHPPSHSRRLSLARPHMVVAAALSKRSRLLGVASASEERAREAGLPLPSAHFRRRLRKPN